MRDRAEPDCSAASIGGPAEIALHRAWLPPSAASLTALALHPSPATWLTLRDDPGAVLLLLRRPADESHPTFLARMLDPAVLDEAVRLLELPGEDAVDWNADIVRPIYDAAVALAGLARDDAVRGGDCDPDEAWACGLLAPLGWLGVCAADPAAAAACLADPEFLRSPSQIQRRRWGLDQAALARRLGRRWRLPHWLTDVIGCLRLPAELACCFGPNPALLRCVQGAIGRLREQGVDLGLGMAAPSQGQSARAARGAGGVPGLGIAVPVAAAARPAADRRREPPAARGGARRPPRSGSRSAARRPGKANVRRRGAAEGRQARRPGGVCRRRRPRDQQPARRHFRPGSVSAGPRRRLVHRRGRPAAQGARRHHRPDASHPRPAARRDAVRAAGGPTADLVRSAGAARGNGGGARRIGRTAPRPHRGRPHAGPAGRLRRSGAGADRAGVPAAQRRRGGAGRGLGPRSRGRADGRRRDRGGGGGRRRWSRSGAAAGAVRPVLFRPVGRARPRPRPAGGLAAGPPAGRRRAARRGAAGRTDPIHP